MPFDMTEIARAEQDRLNRLNDYLEAPEDGPEGVDGPVGNVGVNGDEMQAVLEVENEKLKAKILDLQLKLAGATVTIENQLLIDELERNERLQQDVNNRDKALYEYALAMKDIDVQRRGARQLLQLICNHEDTMAETEIMLKLVMDFIYLPPDDVGDIPF